MEMERKGFWSKAYKIKHASIKHGGGCVMIQYMCSDTDGIADMILMKRSLSSVKCWKTERTNGSQYRWIRTKKWLQKQSKWFLRQSDGIVLNGWVSDLSLIRLSPFTLTKDKDKNLQICRDWRWLQQIWWCLWVSDLTFWCTNHLQSVCSITLKHLKMKKLLFVNTLN